MFDVNSKILSLFFICFILILISQVHTIVIDNEVENSPRVYCFQNGLKLQVDTKNPFTGHIYVKGMYGNPQCNRNFTGETKQPALNVAYAECIHNREPLTTGGMMFTLEIIVQFHPYFTTKIDRAFIVSCAYREAMNVVTQNQILQGNVMLPEGSSDSIPITRVSYSPLMPNCQYTIHRGSPDGPLISFARVGEKVVHKWQCMPTADGEFHGILIHNCFARDVRGVNRIQMLDKRGCTLDPFSLPTPTYTLDLTMAYAAVHAFKFADDLQISFACSISLCLRMNDGCVGIAPPQCDGSASTTPTSLGYGQTPAANDAGPAAPPAQSYSAPEASPPAIAPKEPGYSFAFQKSAPADTIYFPDSFANNSSVDIAINDSLPFILLPHPPPADVFLEPNFRPRNAELLLEPESLVIHDSRSAHKQSINKSSAELELEFPVVENVQVHFPNSTRTTTVAMPQTSQSTVTQKITSSTTFTPTTRPSTQRSRSTVRSVSQTQTTVHPGGTTDASLGIFVGEGVINLQPLPLVNAAPSDIEQNPHSSYKMQIYQPTDLRAPNDLQSSSSFANSKQKDAKPVSHIIRSGGKFKKRRTTLGPVTTMSPFDYDDNFVQSSIDVTAQDFIVFDRRNSDLSNETSEMITRARHDICITTLAFTQLVIAMAVFFSILMALAVFFRMRHRKKCVINELHYLH